MDCIRSVSLYSAMGIKLYNCGFVGLWEEGIVNRKALASEHHPVSVTSLTVEAQLYVWVCWVEGRFWEVAYLAITVKMLLWQHFLFVMTVCCVFSQPF